MREYDLSASEMEAGDYEQIVDYLIKALGSDASNQAFWALKNIADERAVDTLINALQQENIRWDAARLLGEIGDKRAIVPLIELFQDDDSDVIIEALAHTSYLTDLLPYLDQESTVWVYKVLIQIGEEQTEDDLIEALWRFGDEAMAVTYLNCGNPALEEAARDWASENGYSVASLPSAGGSGGLEWGEH
jgi:hypothetical protein